MGRASTSGKGSAFAQNVIRKFTINSTRKNRLYVIKTRCHFFFKSGTKVAPKVAPDVFLDETEVSLGLQNLYFQQNRVKSVILGVCYVSLLCHLFWALTWAGATFTYFLF